MSFSIVDEKRPPARPRRARPQPAAIEGPVPEYEVVEKITDGNRPPRPVRKDWKPVLEELVAGNLLFMTLTDLTDANVKYLTLALGRIAHDGRLRTQRTTRNGQAGRLIWVEND